jgi:hypothetical protein
VRVIEKKVQNRVSLPERGELTGGWRILHNDGLCKLSFTFLLLDRLCGLVVRVLGYRFGGPGSIPGTARTKIVGLERGPLSLVSTTEELLDTKVAVPI